MPNTSSEPDLAAEPPVTQLSMPSHIWEIGISKLAPQSKTEVANEEFPDGLPAKLKVSKNVQQTPSSQNSTKSPLPSGTLLVPGEPALEGVQ